MFTLGQKVDYDGTLLDVPDDEDKSTYTTVRRGITRMKGRGIISRVGLPNDWVEVTLDNNGYKIAMHQDRMAIACGLVCPKCGGEEE